LILLVAARQAGAQTTNNFKQSNLVADTSSVGAAHVDANLVNPWGIAFFPGTPSGFPIITARPAFRRCTMARAISSR
jgi:hypothetical protein